MDNFEKEFEIKTAEMKQRRREYYKAKGKDRAPDKNPKENVVYQARASLSKERKVRVRRESIIMRTVRCIKGFRQVRLQYADHAVYSAEKRRKAYATVAKDCYSPIYDGYAEVLETAWDFVVRLFEDFWDVILFICDVIIKGWYYLASFLSYIWDWFYDIRYWIEVRKRGLALVFALLLGSCAVGAVFINSITAYEYYYHGKLLGTTRNKSDVYQTIAVLGDKLSEVSGANVSLDIERDIEFKKVTGLDLEIDSTDDILDTLTYMKELQVYAYAINVDGQQKVILESETVAKNILNTIQNEYTTRKDGVEYTSVNFDQAVTITEVTVQLGDIWNSSDAKSFLKTGSMRVDPEAMPILTVTSIETATYDEDIPFGTKYVQNSSMYADETELISNGILGVNRIVATVERHNGEEVSREIISTTKVSDPVDEVKYQGTKPIPPSDGTGTFKYPVTTYTITSKFGMRWGRMHSGVDFAAPTGTKIYATDGGTVTYSGWKNSYGYVVIIDHGGLYESLYAHCSKLLVEAGDDVYQGKNIALVGSTGNSTGPHLHFEIHYKGVAYNPLDYL